MSVEWLPSYYISHARKMFLNHSGTVEISKNEMNSFRGSYQQYTLFPYVAFADLKRNWIPGARPGALKNLARDGKLANRGRQ